jgi:hypothetical protein
VCIFRGMKHCKAWAHLHRKYSIYRRELNHAQPAGASGVWAVRPAHHSTNHRPTTLPAKLDRTPCWVVSLRPSSSVVIHTQEQEHLESDQHVPRIQTPNSWMYNNVEVSGHNLERSHTWSFCMDFLNHRVGRMVFYQVFFLYFNRTCKRLREFTSENSVSQKKVEKPDRKPYLHPYGSRNPYRNMQKP